MGINSTLVRPSPKYNIKESYNIQTLSIQTSHQVGYDLNTEILLRLRGIKRPPNDETGPNACVRSTLFGVTLVAWINPHLAKEEYGVSLTGIHCAASVPLLSFTV